MKKSTVRGCTRFVNSIGTEKCERCGGLGKNHRPAIHAKALGLRQIELLQLLAEGARVHVGPLGSTSLWLGDIVYDLSWAAYLSLDKRGLLESAPSPTRAHCLSRYYKISKYGRRVLKALVD